MMAEKDYDKLYKILTFDEGYREKPYIDSTGNISIGIGRNLTANGVSDQVIKEMFCEDLVSAQESLISIFPNCSQFTDARRYAIINMIYNLGHNGFSKFKNLIEAIKDNNWALAASHALDSRWARQVKSRSTRVAYMLRTGEFHEDYRI